MAKIDLDKLICSLAKRKYFSEEKLQGALKEQDLEYKDGEIVEIQKPKFKVGDWVVDNHGEVNQVTSVTDDSYGFTLYDGTYVSGCWKDYYHHWTIEDAKEGDVLAFDTSEHIILVKETHNSAWGWRLSCWCHVLESEFEVVEYHIKSEGLRPATKEQHDLLFQKMKEAGYEWDDEKKELKKIENKGKASFANRQLYNRAILTILSNYVEKYPDIRFGQMLYNLGIGPVFNEESRETHWNLSKTIDKRK